MKPCQAYVDMDEKAKPMLVTGPRIVLRLIIALGKETELAATISHMNAHVFCLSGTGSGVLKRAKTLFERGCTQNDIPARYRQNAWQILDYTLKAWTQDQRHWPTRDTACGQHGSYIRRFRSRTTWMAESISQCPSETPYRALFSVLCGVLVCKSSYYRSKSLTQTSRGIYEDMAQEMRAIAKPTGIPHEPLLMSMLLFALVYGFDVSLARTCSVPFPLKWPFFTKSSASRHELAAFGIASQISATIFNSLCRGKPFAVPE